MNFEYTGPHKIGDRIRVNYPQDERFHGQVGVLTKVWWWGCDVQFDDGTLNNWQRFSWEEIESTANFNVVGA